MSLPFLAPGADSIAGFTVGGGAGLLVAAQDPHPVWWIEVLRWVGALAVGMLPVVAGSVVRYRRARADALAEHDEKQAARLRADNDPGNDARADALEREAAELRAQSAALKTLESARGIALPLPPDKKEDGQ